MTMPAVVLTADRTIAFPERPRPPLRPDQVVVEVELCAFDDLQASRIMKALIAPNW